jgi:hypothetical protein
MVDVTFSFAYTQTRHMAPAQKKQKTETTEKELEDLLFGDVSEDIWDKAGHELEDQEEEQDAFNDESNEEDEEEAEQVIFFFLKNGYIDAQAPDFYFLFFFLL